MRSSNARLGRLALAVALLAAIPRGAPAWAEEPTLTSVIVVRHAEKLEDSDDPGLTPAGESRAQHLRDLLAHAGVDAIYATQFKRTQSTVQPLAQAQGLEVSIVDAGNIEALTAGILSQNGGGVVVVAGHSNTVPGIVAALGAAEPDAIDESEYGNLFVVTVPSTGRASALKLWY